MGVYPYLSLDSKLLTWMGNDCMLFLQKITLFMSFVSLLAYSFCNVHFRMLDEHVIHSDSNPATVL